MRVLVLGGGGREHALCWALARSGHEVLCGPGNAGIAEVARVVALDAEDPEAVVAAARDEGADLVVVGPEAPLVAGVADALAAAGVPVFGPTAKGAAIEGSKAFAKAVMAEAGVPTAGYWTGTDAAEAKKALDGFAPPYVVKADGLAAGKGVRICADRAEAEEAIDDAIVRRVFGEAGGTVVIEEFMTGPEVSLFGLCDGRTVVPMVPAQDFKRALDGDQGLNTGGMGAYSPVPAFTPAMVADVRRDVLQPVLDALAARGIDYVGVLYAGLMLTPQGVKVLEFNARFGDPETQVVLPRLRSDLGELLLACATGRLAAFGPLEWDERACVTVIMASGGYPGDYRTGVPIGGLAEAAALEDVMVFHAGTRADAGQTVTAGGRVLAVSAFGDGVAAARERAYEGVDRIGFAGAHVRRDIAARPTGG
ncbi:MAG TPA: phosphoribosylamine--glycine ligase [Egibacteraceae bacterium]|nr:phosphoribosylamine--glycine ligase [Egibacteraceae bacterium]